MAEIKAIETEYNGYRFRSRLEARWAVFFDAMDIKYEYEPEGYRMEDGTMYLPDFKIQVKHRSYTSEDAPIFVEVKGNMDAKSLYKISAFSHSFPIYIVGTIPKSTDDMLSFSWQEGYLESCFYSFRYMDGDEYPAIFSIYNNTPWICGPDHDEYSGIDIVDKCLEIARMVRFEHGETPTPESIKKSLYKSCKFKHIYMSDPIDFWTGAEEVTGFLKDVVLQQMPEMPRNKRVYRFFLPDPPSLSPVYLCKADNNGTIFMFTNFNLLNYFKDFINAVYEI